MELKTLATCNCKQLNCPCKCLYIAGEFISCGCCEDYCECHCVTKECIYCERESNRIKRRHALNNPHDHCGLCYYRIHKDRRFSLVLPNVCRQCVDIIRKNLILPNIEEIQGDNEYCDPADDDQSCNHFRKF